jgi:hypothetical protein
MASELGEQGFFMAMAEGLLGVETATGVRD